MALEDQLVSIVFDQGLDTKSDPKRVLPGHFVELENAVLTRPGILQKRNGYDVLPQLTSTGTKLMSAQGIVSFANELLLFSGGQGYSFSPATKTWLAKGAVTPCATATTPIVRNSASQSNPDSAINGNIEVSAWEDSRGGVRVSVRDVVSGVFHQTDVQLNATATQPRVVAFGTDLVVFYTNGINLYYRRIPVAIPSTLRAEANVVGTLVSGNNRYDVLTVGQRLFLCWNDSGPSAAVIAYLTTTYVLSTTVSTLVAASNAITLFADQDQNIYVTAADSSTVRVRPYTYALGALNAAVVIESGLTIARVAGIAPATTTASKPSGSISIYYEINPVSVTSRNNVRVNTLSVVTWVAGTAADFKRGVGLYGRPFQAGDTPWYLTVAYQSPFQAQYFLVDNGGAIIGKAHATVGGGLRTNACLATLNSASATAFSFSAVVQARFTAQGGTVSAIAGINTTTWAIASANPLTARLNNNLILAGSIPLAYDGVSFTESGFLLYPEGITSDATSALTITHVQTGDATHQEKDDLVFPAPGRIGGGQYFTFYSTTTGYYMYFVVDGAGTDPAPVGFTASSVSILSTDTSSSIAQKVQAAINAIGGGSVFAATVVTSTLHFIVAANGAVTAQPANGAAPNGVATGSVATGTYSYVAIYEWPDNFGQTVRSTTSILIPVTVSGAPNSVTLTIPTLRLTARDGVARAAVRVAVYRTTAGGSSALLYRLTPIPSKVANSLTSDLVYYFDSVADSAITSNELVYTTGGVLSNDPPPPSTMATMFRTRVVLAGLEDPNQIAYSQAGQKGESVWFSDSYRIQLDGRGGPITALGALDDKLVIFKQDAIFVMAGIGPTLSGQQNDFTAPILVTADVGCITAASVVAFSGGLLFQSAKGLYLLDRSLSAQYIGAPVEAFNGQTLSGAQLVPNTNQVRFVSSADKALVYDYLVGQWATFSGHPSVGCTVWQSLFVFARSDGRVYQEHPGIFTDGFDRPVKLRVRTGWISLAQVQGFQRVRRCMILGDYRGPHKLHVQIATNYAPAFSQDQLLDATSVLGTSNWGSDATWGAGALWGGTTTPYEWNVHVKAQKSQAIQIALEDVQNSGYNEGTAINGIALLVAAKKGAAKVPALQRT